MSYVLAPGSTQIDVYYAWMGRIDTQTEFWSSLVHLYVLHKTSGIASSKVSASSLIQVLCTVFLSVVMAQLLYNISNHC